jgi:cellulose synthase/poly-beta-1,6-N-acetylglucosamine synthase-like glycosyltransferase
VGGAQSEQVTASEEAVAVTVAIATYKRPALLADALALILEQVTRSDIPVDVVVVDNDPQGSALEVVLRFAGAGVRYVAEPRPGLAAARNAALGAARTRLLVFVDDDGRPDAEWLARLVETWRRTGADAVAGPAVRELPDVVEPWVRASRFFERRPRVTGSRVPGAGTGNLLLDLAALRRLDLRFDERFGLTGGEDTMLTRSLTARGGVIVWCEEAVLVDPVPPDRATRSWVLRREYRMGSTWSRVHLAVAPPGRARARQAAGLAVLGGGLLARGALRAAAGRATRTLGSRAEGERELARGRGVLAGVVGRRVEEYGRPRAQR